MMFMTFLYAAIFFVYLCLCQSQYANFDCHVRCSVVQFVAKKMLNCKWLNVCCVRVRVVVVHLKILIKNVNKTHVLVF